MCKVDLTLPNNMIWGLFQISYLGATKSYKYLKLILFAIRNLTRCRKLGTVDQNKHCTSYLPNDYSWYVQEIVKQLMGKCSIKVTYFLQVFSEAGGIPTTSMVPSSVSSGAPNTSGNCEAFLLLLWNKQHKLKYPPTWSFYKYTC